MPSDPSPPSSKRLAADKTLEAWDIRHWPAAGDQKIEDVYVGVGRALSSWGQYEAALAGLFHRFLVGGGASYGASRAFGAVRTFEGRQKMLRAAAAAYFLPNPDKPGTDFEKRFTEVAKLGERFGERRNDIAHGVATTFFDKDAGCLRHSKGYTLQPTWADASKRDINWAPDFSYSSHELAYYSERFIELCKEPSVLGGEIAGRPRS